ncbi:MAG: RidA family protein [Desulfobacula sp.]|nr:RidA family protein [Desulfobacula sp.]
MIIFSMYWGRQDKTQRKDVVRIGIWVDDPRDFPEFNKIFSQYFDPEFAPARVTVQTAMMCDCKVEIDAIVYKKP